MYTWSGTNSRVCRRGATLQSAQKQKSYTKLTKNIFGTFRNIDGFLPPKRSELAVLQKYKARVVLRGGHVKDDTGFQAVCTEQGASASQLTAAKVLDTVSRLRGMAGEAKDAVSLAHTQNEGRSQTARASRDTPQFVWCSLVIVQQHGATSMTQRFLRKAFCTATRCQDYCGNVNWKNHFCKTIGKK